MSRYRKNKSLDAPPAFDIARQWRHPAILFVLTAVIVISTSLVIQGLRGGAPPMASILALDISQSALDNPDWRVAAICDRYQQYLQPGDYQADIWLADEAMIGADKTIENLPNSKACHPSPEAVAKEDLGQLPGTSLHQAVSRISGALQSIPATHLGAPVLGTVVLDESESGPTVTNELESLTQEITELAATKRLIRFLGPDGETATRLRQMLRLIPNARFCPLNNAERDVSECLEVVFEEARSIDK